MSGIDSSTHTGCTSCTQLRESVERLGGTVAGAEVVASVGDVTPGRVEGGVAR